MDRVPYPTKDTAAEADKANMDLLMNIGGISRDQAQMCVDMGKHLENQIEDLYIRTMQACDAKLVPIYAVLAALIIERSGHKLGTIAREVLLEDLNKVIGELRMKKEGL